MFHQYGDDTNGAGSCCFVMQSICYLGRRLMTVVGFINAPTSNASTWLTNNT